ncbi:MAG: ATP-binding protein, partial [Siculibacillus sp.]|nr:ATP-binding protein [Siculibacillus sp.]
EIEKALDEIVAEILSDPEAAFRPLAVLFQDFQFHCRLRRLGGVAQDMSSFRRRLALARAGVEAKEGADDDWSRVIAMSEGLPEEMQGVFLMVARAARDEAPCPSDAALAQAYGSHSPSRGRWLLSYMAERGLIVSETDFRGNRIVAVAGVGWRTRPAGGTAAVRSGRTRSAATTARMVTESLRRSVD